MRLYAGINHAAIGDLQTRSSLKVMDDFLRDASRALSALQPATDEAEGAAPSRASFVCMTSEARLRNERQLAASSPLVLTDGGPNGNATLSVTLGALGGVPALTFGTSNAGGSASTLVRTDATIALFDGSSPAALGSAAAPGTNAFAARTDHVHIFPTTLKATTGGLGTLTLTDDTLRTILTSSLTAIRLSASGGKVFDATPGQYDFYQTDGATIGLRITLAASTSNPFNFILPAMTSTAATGALLAVVGTYSPASGAITNRFGVDSAMKYDGTTTDLGAKQFFGGRFYARITAGSTVGNNAGDEVGGAILGTNSLVIEATRTLANWYTVKPEYSNWTINGALTRAVAYYHPGFPAGTNKWAFYNDSTDLLFSGGHFRMNDSVKHVLGTGQDLEVFYDGTNAIIDPDVVGTGILLIGATGDDDMRLTNIEIDGALNHDGTTVGVFNTAPATQQTITGSRVANPALASLLTALATYGLIIDSTTA